MKILRVINSLNIGGAERSVAGNVPLHILNGFETDVLLLDGNKTFFVEELLKKNVNVMSLGYKNFIYNPLFIFKISKIIKNYDIVHVHLFPSFYWVGLANFFSKQKVKLVYTEHSTYNRRRDNFVFKLLDQFIYKQYDKIIAISPETKGELTKHIGKSDIITIPNGVDLLKVVEEAKEEVPYLTKKYLNKKIIVQVAGFRSSKDQDTVIKCLAVLPPGYVVFFVGDGDRFEFCKQLAKSLNVDDRIEFLGLQSNIGAIINIADILVMSSHWEGFGRAAVEGMALSKPVLATNVNGLAEVVSGAGLLFEAGDVNKLKHLILQLEDETFYNEVAAECFIRAQRYDIKQMINAYELIYDELHQ